MPGRLMALPPGKGGTPAATTPPASALDALIKCNPGLSLTNILALWRWIGPSRRVH